MFDIRWIREEPEAFDTAMKRRGLDPLSADILALDARRREAQTELQTLQTRRNEASKAIGEAKRKYAIVGVFIVAAIFTPPDPLSQLSLAIPIIILYEISILMAKMVEKKRAEAEAEDDLDLGDDDPDADEDEHVPPGP